MGAIGVFEADANESKLSAEAAANNGFELDKATDRAIFRARERFGAYLANAKSRADWDERWEEVKPQVIRVIAEVTTPTPGVLRRVGAALRPAPVAPSRTKPDRPSSAKTAGASEDRRTDIPDLPTTLKQAAVTKTAWSYDASTKLWTSNDPMQKFACPGCGTEQDHLGFNKCAGCDRQWNSWPVRQAGTDKTSASTYVLMAREIKMRGDQFKLAAESNVKIADSDYNFGDDKKDDDSDDDDSSKKSDDDSKSDDDADDDDSDDDKMEKDSSTKVAGPMMPMPGTMPGDNSGAVGAPEAPAAPAPAGPPAGGPMPGDSDRDGDVGGGITEGSPIDQIQDALEGAVMALKDVQMLSINPVLAKTASSKVAALKSAMNRFWALHKQMDYVAGMLAKEANEAIRAADPRITSEAMFVQGFEAAAQNAPLPANTSREYLEGYIAFHKQADAYDDGANTGGLFQPGGQDESVGSTRNDGTFLGDGGLDDSRNNQAGNEGPADGAAAAAFAAQEDGDNAAGANRGQTGESTSIQPTGARRRK